MPMDAELIDMLEQAIVEFKRTQASPASAPEGFTMSEPAILPDGSGFGIMSFPLPKDHWIYKEREYEDGAIEPNDLPAPVLTHSFRRQVIAAIRYAVRGATNCGKEDDFDPDALVQNAVYALCGPYGKAAPTPPVSESVDPVMTKEELIAAAESIGMRFTGASIPPASEDRKDAERLHAILETLKMEFYFAEIDAHHPEVHAIRKLRTSLFAKLTEILKAPAMQEDKP